MTPVELQCDVMMLWSLFWKFYPLFDVYQIMEDCDLGSKAISILEHQVMKT
jgi:hypothetical protein